MANASPASTTRISIESVPLVVNGTTAKVSLGLDGTPDGAREFASAPPQQKMMTNDDIRDRARVVGIEDDKDYKRTAMCMPCCVVVEPNYQAAVFFCGTYRGTIKTPGIHIISCCEDWRMVSMKRNALEMKDIKVLDSNGNPIMISGNVTFAFMSAAKPSIEVEDAQRFLYLQAMAVLKRIASRYPYEAPEGEPCLKSEIGAFAQELVDELQTAALPTGAVVLSYDLTDLSYAPEIAQAMLQRQHAQAMVKAREIIVHAAVNITDQALTQLKEKGHKFDDAAEQRICGNLLTVICSGQSATPTLSVGYA